MEKNLLKKTLKCAIATSMALNFNLDATQNLQIQTHSINTREKNATCCVLKKTGEFVTIKAKERIPMACTVQKICELTTNENSVIDNSNLFKPILIDCGNISTMSLTGGCVSVGDIIIVGETVAEVVENVL